MKRTVNLLIQVTVDELSLDDRAYYAEVQGCSDSDIRGVEEVNDLDLGEAICDALCTSQELFDGSMLPCQITNAVLVNAATDRPPIQ